MALGDQNTSKLNQQWPPPATPPAPCPGCGRCPTCGKGGTPVTPHPYYPRPRYGPNYWGGSGANWPQYMTFC